MSPPRRGRPPGSTGIDLLAVARDVFLEYGYAGASMDEVASRARVSKSSLYREHASKASLYAAAVTDWAAAGQEAMRPALDRLMASKDLHAGLIEFAETLRAAILSPDVVRMRRLVTSEAATQPEAAATYLKESWNANIKRLADVLQLHTHSGRLKAADSHLAAEQLTWLVVGAPLNATLLGAEWTTHATAPAAVDLFLAGYGKHGAYDDTK